MTAAIPAIEGTDHGDPGRIRRPDQEADATHTRHLERMGAELLVDLAMIALADQVDVDLAQDLGKAVRVVDLDSLVVDLEAEPIDKGGFGFADDTGKQAAGMLARQLGKRGPRLVQHPDPRGLGLKAADHHLACSIGVRPQQREGIAVVTAHQRLDRLGVRSVGPASWCHRPDLGLPAGRLRP